MSRKMSKLELLQEFRYTEKAKEVTDMVDLERKMKAYVRQNDITVRSYNKDYQENDVASGAKYTQDLLREHPELGRHFESVFRSNAPSRGGSTGSRRNRNACDNGDSWQNKGYFSGMISFYDDQLRRGRRARREGYRERRSMKEFLFSPLGVVLMVIALCVILYELVGPAVYAFIMDGPFFKILLTILAGAAVVAVLKSARGWPSGVKFTVILVIGLVLLFSIVGPAVYSFLMSGALFRIICLVIAVAASIGIFKGDLGWPIGIKLVVIAVIWVVLKDQVL